MRAIDAKQQRLKEPASGVSRRNIIGRTGVSAAAVAFLSTMGPVGEMLAGKKAYAQSAFTDSDILNFALNLEYLEGEYYTRGSTGVGLANNLVTGVGAFGGVNGGTLVPFVNPYFLEIALKIASDEQAHIAFLRAQLGSAAVARPLIDLAGSFQAAALASGAIPAGTAFNPFANEIDFFLGAFTLTEVGITAYNGAAALISNPAILSAAASILAVEAYHAGAIRGVLTQSFANTNTAEVVITGADVSLAGLLPFQSQAIANLQSTLSGATTAVGTINPLNVFAQLDAVDGNSLAFRRTFNQVINVVENGNGANHAGGFFPLGLNGNIN